MTEVLKIVLVLAELGIVFALLRWAIIWHSERDLVKGKRAKAARKDKKIVTIEFVDTSEYPSKAGEGITYIPFDGDVPF